MFAGLEEYRFYLLSSSPRRLDILKQIGVNPIVLKSNFAEDLRKEDYPNKIDYVRDTCYNKFLDVYNREGESLGDKIFMLSADTVILCNNEIFEKPKTIENNINMLKKFRDWQIQQIPIKIVTCCTLFKRDGKEIIKKFDNTTEIQLIDGLTDQLIEVYCSTGEGVDVAGGFKIQGRGSILFKGIIGDFFNCVGLSANQTAKEINELL